MLVIVDYGMGNLRSVVKAFARVQVPAHISSNIHEIEKASKIILPGVGHFGRGMENLRARGFEALLNDRVLGARVPVLGICMGMQLFSTWGEEGDCAGLGWIPSRTVRFRIPSTPGALKVPHMGWNGVEVMRSHPLVHDIGVDASFYFAHSYHLECDDPSHVLGATTYGYSFPSIVQRDHMAAVQFHPEKSHRFGLQLLKNFAMGA